MRYLGLDLGSRTLGISISDPSGMIASSYGVIRHQEEYARLVQEVADLVQELHVDGVSRIVAMSFCEPRSCSP